MTWRMKLKLPSFKLSAHGEAVYRNVPRGQRCASQQLQSANKMEMTSSYRRCQSKRLGGWDWACTQLGDWGWEGRILQYLGLHQIKQQANAAAWNGLRSVNQVLFNAVLNAQMQHNIGGLSVDQCLRHMYMFWWIEVPSCIDVSTLKKYGK